MKQALRALFIVAATLGLSACLEMKSVVTVNKDGSGTIEETVLLGAQLKAMLGSLGAQPAGGDAGNPAAALKDLVPDKAKAEERAKQFGEGVTVKSHEEVNAADGKGGTKVVFAFADIRKLKYVPFDAKDKDSGKQEPMTFTLEGDTLTMLNPDDGKKGDQKVEKPKVSKEEMAGQLAMMKPLFAGMRMSIFVKSASGIASSDATHLDGDTVTLMDVQVDKFLDNSDVFVKFMESAEDSMTQAQLAEAFKGVDGIKVEGKKAVAVKLK